MWAFRRACMRFRNCRLTYGHAQMCCGKFDMIKCSLENYNDRVVGSQEHLLDGSIYYMKYFDSHSTSLKKVRTFSSLVSGESIGEEDFDADDSFSEPETVCGLAEDAAFGDENEVLFSGSDSSKVGADDDRHDLLDIFDTTGEKNSPERRVVSEIIKGILAAPASLMSSDLDKWVEEGNEVTRSEVALAVHHLRKQHLFLKALKLLEWAETTMHHEYVASDYASRVYLIAKVHGVDKAEEYLNKIPGSFRGEKIYRILLTNFVSVTNVKKSEELFNKMRSLGFLTRFSCNQMLILYMRTNKKRIANVLELMKNESIKASLLTYQILIHMKGRSKDVTGMEQIVLEMRAQECEPNARILALLAQHYTASGFTDKAGAVLKEMEGTDISKNRQVCHLLLPRYAALGREYEVDRIWKVCESDARVEECMAVIEAWGQLNKIETAEAVLEKLLRKVKNPSPRHFVGLLKTYMKHNMLDKEKDLMTQMEALGCAITPLTLHSLVKLYIGAGEVEKADSVLKKCIKLKLGQPLFTSCVAVLNKYASRGDVHNAEKIFLMMRQVGYMPRELTYRILFRAYANAKFPAYGFGDRMKADNVSTAGLYRNWKQNQKYFY